MSNTTQSIDSTQGLDQAVQDAESTLDTLKDGKAEAEQEGREGHEEG